MKLIIDSIGRVDFTTTRQAVTTCELFRKGRKNFGAGEENYAECAACRRQLPTVCMHIDHISAVATTAHSLVKPELIYLYNMDGTPSTKFRAITDGSLVSIGSSPYDIKTLDAKKVWENNLDNLQFLCMNCNTSKGTSIFTGAKAPFGALLPPK